MHIELMGKIMDQLKEAIMKVVIEEGGKVKLTCEAAFAVAEELDIDLKEITRFCNKKDIRISKCQLFCFK